MAHFLKRGAIDTVVDSLHNLVEKVKKILNDLH